MSAQRRNDLAPKRAPRRRPVEPRPPLRMHDRRSHPVSKLALAALSIVVLAVALAVFLFATRLFTMGAADNTDDLNGYLGRVATLEEQAAAVRGDRGLADLVFGPADPDEKAAWEESVTADPAAVADEGASRTADWTDRIGEASAAYEQAGAVLQEADKLELGDAERSKLDRVRETMELHIYSLQLEKQREQMAEKGVGAFRQAEDLESESARARFLRSELKPILADWNDNVKEQEGITARQQQLTGEGDQEGL